MIHTRALLAALLLGGLAVGPAPAAADPPCGRGWRRDEYCGPRWRHREYRPLYREPVIVAPPPAVYVRPRVYAPAYVPPAYAPPVYAPPIYAPPAYAAPTYVAPTYVPPGTVPPVYVQPPPSSGVNIPLR